MEAHRIQVRKMNFESHREYLWRGLKTKCENEVNRRAFKGKTVF